MNREDDQHLWDLLERLKAPQPSPFFARNVLREIREKSGRKATVRRWLGWRALFPTTAVAAAMVTALMLVYGPSAHEKSTDADSELITKIDPQDYEAVADLDELLASEDNNLWDDNSSL